MNRYVVLTVLAAGLMGSCQPGAKPVTGGETALAAVESAAYLDAISSQTTVSEADAVRGVLLLVGEGGATTFQQGVAALKGKGIASSEWDFDAARTMTKGKLAFMIYQACALKGGATLALTGPSQRYCLKELQYRGLMGAGYPYSPVGGLELVSVLARADEWRTTGNVSTVLKREAVEQ